MGKWRYLGYGAWEQVGEGGAGAEEQETERNRQRRRSRNKLNTKKTQTQETNRTPENKTPDADSTWVRCFNQHDCRRGRILKINKYHQTVAVFIHHPVIFDNYCFKPEFKALKLKRVNGGKGKYVDVQGIGKSMDWRIFGR